MAVRFARQPNNDQLRLEIIFVHAVPYGQAVSIKPLTAAEYLRHLGGSPASVDDEVADKDVAIFEGGVVCDAARAAATFSVLTCIC